MDPARLLKELRTQHWTTTIGEIAAVEAALTAHGLTAAWTQRGQSRQFLRPVPVGEAHPNTMSAVFGDGAQPLHTDGAHLREPPDLILLASAEPNGTPTRVWSGARAALGGSMVIFDTHPEFARFGIFVVRGGRESFLAPASEWGRLRVDPVCMSPADSYARQAADYFQNLPAFDFHWDVPKKILLIDNRYALHGRSATSIHDTHRKLERRSYRWGVTK